MPTSTTDINKNKYVSEMIDEIDINNYKSFLIKDIDYDFKPKWSYSKHNKEYKEKLDLFYHYFRHLPSKHKVKYGKDWIESDDENYFLFDDF